MASAILLAAGACHRPSGHADSAQAAVAITDRYWADTLPQVDLRKLSKRVIDRGDHWEVIYDPNGGAGAVWVFEVDKASGRIVHVKGGQ